MSLVVNNNMMAANAARNLNTVYKRLSSSTQRLSSGLRINSAADDAAGLAIRELMRCDITTTKQGIRNAADAISMIQTADGALAVIDEKLTRMKELAEQAATGTYTTVQRDIINSEYQAMAKEIDRIANATNFNGIKLLDGSISTQHQGRGLKVHFGTGNSEAEDYYFINIGDARASTFSGLRVGGDAKNDIWGQGSAAAGKLDASGCCSGGYQSLNEPAGFISGSIFSFGYNWDWKENEDEKLLTGKYTAGLWRVGSSESLQQLVNRVNEGSQSRVGIKFEKGVTSRMLTGQDASGLILSSGFAVCIGNEAYYWGSSAKVGQSVDTGKELMPAAPADSDELAGRVLTSAINNNVKSDFWAMWDDESKVCYVFAKQGGNKNDMTACERIVKGEFSTTAQISAMSKMLSFENVATGHIYESGTHFSLGGEHWGRMIPVLTQEKQGFETWNLRLEGRDVGKQRDLWIANVGHGQPNDFNTGENLNTIYRKGQMQLIGMDNASNARGLDRESFVEVQNAANGEWPGAEVRTQSSAQEALEAITAAIVRKDIIRADLGALQNRLENTMTNLEIQAENLQASESRISDVDVALEMTEFTRNNIITQAATSMLAQANSLTQMALTLLG